MRRAFTRWLRGDPPAIVGAWLDQSGVCLVQVDGAADAPGLMRVIYEPCGQYADGAESLTETHGPARTNALRAAYEKLGSGAYALALGISSTDIFIKTIEIPLGLDDQQVDQLSVVEAVSNLPVPPEEICSDYLRRPVGAASGNEKVDVAFCRREVIDALSVLAEDAGIRLAIVDREIQAMHDAAQWCYKKQLGKREMQYPLGILVLADAAQFLICRSALDLTSYELRSNAEPPLNQAPSTILEELSVYCRRAGLTDSPQGYLKQLLVSTDRAAGFNWPGACDMLAAQVDEIDPRVLTGAGSDGLPLTGLMVATGMAVRQSQ